ncbi:MAG: TetR/AcrR family transcriptional regulator [Acidimicrobiales bacterium]
MAPRTNQKARTRQAITDGCAELLDEQSPTTIDDIAAHTGISRATIYRYFASSSDIVWHVMSDREIESSESVATAAGPDPLDRIVAAEKAVNDYIFANPTSVRQFEASVVQRVLDGTADADDRPARRLRYIDAALEPLVGELDDTALRRLRHGLALALGTEAFIALVDTCRLDDDDARATAAWVCRALVTQAMADAPTP